LNKSEQTDLVNIHLGFTEEKLCLIFHVAGRDSFSEYFKRQEYDQHPTFDEMTKFIQDNLKKMYDPIEETDCQDIGHSWITTDDVTYCYSCATLKSDYDAGERNAGEHDATI